MSLGDMERQLAEEVKDEIIKEVLKPEIPQTYDELQFSEAVEKVIPLLESMQELLAGGRLSLKTQKYRIANNDLIVRSQEKAISDNKVLIEENTGKAKDIIEEAQKKAKEVENNMKNRVAQINMMEREAKKKIEEAGKILFDAKGKVKV